MARTRDVMHGLINAIMEHSQFFIIVLLEAFGP